MNAVEGIKIVASVGEKLYAWIAGIIADRQKSAEEVRKEAVALALDIAEDVVRLRQRVYADDAAAVQEAAEGKL